MLLFLIKQFGLQRIPAQFVVDDGLRKFTFRFLFCNTRLAQCRLVLSIKSTPALFVCVCVFFSLYDLFVFFEKETE